MNIINLFANQLVPFAVRYSKGCFFPRILRIEGIIWKRTPLCFGCRPSWRPIPPPLKHQSTFLTSFSYSFISLCKYVQLACESCQERGEVRLELNQTTAKREGLSSNIFSFGCCGRIIHGRLALLQL
jgi:hypothetical protein